jgi:hypothetical protein
LDELARKNQELAERSKNRRHDYKLVGSDIIKTDPEPLPTHFKVFISDIFSILIIIIIQRKRGAMNVL